MSDIQQAIREAIATAIWPPVDDDPEPELADEALLAADDVLATRFPQVCQTCKGSGYVVNFEESGVRSCSDCPTLLTLLLWGWNVSQAEPRRTAAGPGVWLDQRGHVSASTLLAALREVPT